jgi:NAD(P)-dependent dehydrogenase (short-subunit alcohol dehydrogenase family)
MADAFVREGANVVYASRTKERLDSVVESITDEGPSGDALAIQADVRSWSDVTDLVASAEMAFGSIDVFVNNAGINQLHVDCDGERRPVHEIPVESWDAVVETNLRGAFLGTRAVLPSMLSRDRGILIYVSSGHGISGRANRSPYVASKFGLEGFHESLALELAETGVDSITLRPPDGGVYTQSSDEYGRSRDTYSHQDPAVIAEPAVQLAAGTGESSGRYIATPDGKEHREYSR